LRSFLPPAFVRRHSSKYVQRGRYAAPLLRWVIHRFWL
jgi:hypothetical protein